MPNKPPILPILCVMAVVFAVLYPGVSLLVGLLFAILPYLLGGLAAVAVLFVLVVALTNGPGGKQSKGWRKG